MNIKQPTSTSIPQVANHLAHLGFAYTRMLSHCGDRLQHYVNIQQLPSTSIPQVASHLAHLGFTNTRVLSHCGDGLRLWGAGDRDAARCSWAGDLLRLRSRTDSRGAEASSFTGGVRLLLRLLWASVLRVQV